MIIDTKKLQKAVMENKKKHGFNTTDIEFELLRLHVEANELFEAWLKNHGISQSMSRKGNSLDDGLMEGFFGILKREMFYGFEKQYKNLTELEDAIRDYIEYYNQNRIKIKLKGLTPLEYRQLVLS